MGTYARKGSQAGNKDFRKAHKTKRYKRDADLVQEDLYVLHRGRDAVRSTDAVSRSATSDRVANGGRATASHARYLLDQGASGTIDPRAATDKTANVRERQRSRRVEQRLAGEDAPQIVVAAARGTMQEDDDVVGMGQFYCLVCSRHFCTAAVLREHCRTKVHKRCLKRARDDVPYSHDEADMGAGMAPVDDGARVQHEDLAVGVVRTGAAVAGTTSSVITATAACAIGAVLRTQRDAVVPSLAQYRAANGGLSTYRSAALQDAVALGHDAAGTAAAGQDVDTAMAGEDSDGALERERQAGALPVQEFSLGFELLPAGVSRVASSVLSNVVRKEPNHLFVDDYAVEEG